MRGSMRLFFLLTLAGISALASCGRTPSAVNEAPCPAQPTGEVALPAGDFLMGATPQQPEEGPPRRVRVDAFSIDRTEVTVADFAAFVAATGYVTEAERAPDPRLYPGVPKDQLVPSSLVFVGADVNPNGNDPSLWWRIMPGASWRRPFGAQTPNSNRDREPVVQVSYADALAYAQWKGRDLPTEAEWEYAARGGVDGAAFVWGEDKRPPGPARANTWQGLFPALDSGEDGYKAKVAPVGCFPANGFGLYDMAGNVWEWTKTPYAGAQGHTIKGGSFL